MLGAVLVAEGGDVNAQASRSFPDRARAIQFEFVIVNFQFHALTVAARFDTAGLFEWRSMV